MMWNYGGDTWSWLWMTGAVIVFLIGIFFVVAWAARRSGATPHDTSMDVLRRRLAAGEITPEEFEKTRKALGA